MPMAICLVQLTSFLGGTSLPSRSRLNNGPYGQYSMMMQKQGAWVLTPLIDWLIDIGLFYLVYITCKFTIHKHTLDYITLVQNTIFIQNYWVSKTTFVCLIFSREVTSLRITLSVRSYARPSGGKSSITFLGTLVNSSRQRNKMVSDLQLEAAG